MVHPPAVKPVTPLWDTLAAVRFFLAIIIVASHIRVVARSTPLVDALARCSAYTAILSFLIISGFSIAHSIGKQPDGFYRRRIGRIYPLYCLSVLLPMAFNATGTPTTPRDWGVTLQNLVFLQSFTTLQTRFNPVTWTLGVEVACYVMAPWFVRRRTWLLLLLATTSAAGFLWAAFTHASYPGYMLMGEPLLVIAWAWLAGFIFYRYHRRFSAAVALGVAVTGVLVISDLSFGRFHLLPVFLTVSALAFGRLLRLPKPLRALMSFSGDVSYPLYLFHLPTMNIIIYYFGVTSNLALAVDAVAVATVFTLVDIACKRLKRFLFGRSDQTDRPGDSRKSTVITPNVTA